MSFTPINTQEEFDQRIAERLSRADNKHKEEMDALRATYAGFDNIKKECEDLKKEKASLLAEKADYSKKIESANAERDSYRTDLEKTRIALDAGLTHEYASYLQGSSAEEWKSSAEFLAKNVPGKGSPAYNPEGFRGGGGSDREKEAAFKAMAASLSKRGE